MCKRKTKESGRVGRTCHHMCQGGDKRVTKQRSRTFDAPQEVRDRGCPLLIFNLQSKIIISTLIAWVDESIPLQRASFSTLGARVGTDTRGPHGYSNGTQAPGHQASGLALRGCSQQTDSKQCPCSTYKPWLLLDKAQCANPKRCCLPANLEHGSQEQPNEVFFFFLGFRTTRRWN